MSHRRSSVMRTASWRGRTHAEGPTGSALIPAPAKTGVPPDILRQVKLLELRTRGLVNSLFSGEYR